MRSQAFFNSDVEDSIVAIQLDAEEYGDDESKAYQNYLRAIIEQLKTELP